MKDIPVIRGRSYITSLIAQGEHSGQDFKLTIDNPAKIAHSISAFANANGGHLLIGVKDNGAMAGIRSEEDVYVVEQAASSYCSPEVEVTFNAYNVGGGTVIIKASIPKAGVRPVLCRDDDGKWKAYIRVGDENIVAHRLMVRAWKAVAPLRFSLDATVRAYLELIEANPSGLRPDAVATALGMSQRRADNLTVTLLRAGVIDFRYKAPEFVIVSKENKI